ncbi:MAG: DUF2878 family protein [Bryobacterales bacterium]
MSWLGPCVVAVVALVFALMFTHRGRLRAVFYLTACAAMGFALDTSLTMAGLLEFPRDGQPTLSPLWMTALWVNFAAFAPVGLRWLYGRGALAATLGAAGGPAAYWAGQRLGALEWSAPQAPAAVAAEWAAATPAILWLAMWLERGGRAA